MKYQQFNIYLFKEDYTIVTLSNFALLSVISKLYTGVLNERLVTWAESTGNIYEEQAGFRKERSIVDNIFVLSGVVQKYLCKPRGLFYCT